MTLGLAALIAIYTVIFGLLILLFAPKFKGELLGQRTALSVSPERTIGGPRNDPFQATYDLADDSFAQEKTPFMGVADRLATVEGYGGLRWGDSPPHGMQRIEPVPDLLIGRPEWSPDGGRFLSVPYKALTFSFCRKRLCAFTVVVSAGLESTLIPAIDARFGPHRFHDDVNPVVWPGTRVQASIKIGPTGDYSLTFGFLPLQT